MKASNIILFSAIGSITLLIVTGAMQLRFSGESRYSNIEFESNKIELPEFRYVAISNVQRQLTISSGQNAEIEFSVEKGGKMPTADFYVEGDTLFINDFQWSEKSRALRFTLHVPHKVEGIYAQNSTLEIKDYNKDVLSLNADKSRVSIGLKKHFGKLEINGINRSNIDTYTDQLDTVDLRLDNSRISIHSSVTKLLGTMQNNSELSVEEINDFQFKKDASSRLNHWN